MSILKYLLLFGALTLGTVAHGAGEIFYRVKDLRPAGVSQYAVRDRNAQREYFHFKNAQGNHTFIYEESPESSPLREAMHLRNSMPKIQSRCNVDIVCKEPALCSGSCKNKYYELTNTPEDLSLLDRNHCNLVGFQCGGAAAP